MGRDKPKKYNKMGYFEKEQWKRDEAEKRGIVGETYRDFRGNTQTRVNDKALKESIRNDFDYRTSAQHMDGVKGKGSFDDFTNYERAAVKLHKQAGNEGQYSSNKDITNVTNNLVRDAKGEQAQNFKDMFMNDINALREELGEKSKRSQAAADPQSFEHSDAVANAVANLDKYKLNLGEDTLFSRSNYRPARSDDINDAFKSCVKHYKDDVKVAVNINEANSNLINAANTVASYRE